MSAPAPKLADRLSGVVAGVRADLEISRHVFADGPAYVVRDPISFKTLRLDPGDYRVLIEIRDDRTLGEVFDALCAAGTLEAGRADEFYAFILELHRMGMLTLPVNDAEGLYARFERRRRGEIRSRATGILFLRVPLLNPDMFLDRTARFVRPLFTRWAFAAWCLLMLAALALAASRWDDLRAPLLTMLSGDRLLLLWASLIGLKVVHELGHAYACKAFGGRVPEMGAFLMMFTPCAYVDATDSWSFPSRTKRIIVGLAGMYAESIVGAIALFVWAFTPESPLNSVAYQVVMLSTVVTVLFNLNPLMRYDGYYILSDLLNIPNLRARATGAFQALLRRAALGIRPDAPAPRRLARTMVALGLAFSVYRMLLVLSISMLIASKIYVVGLAIGLAYVLNTLVRSGLRLVRYLVLSEATAHVRARAILTAAVIFIALPAAALLVPVTPSISTRAVVGREVQTTLRATVPGTLRQMVAHDGDAVDASQAIAELENSELSLQVRLAHAAARASLLGLRAESVAHGTLPARWLSEHERDLVRLLDAQSQRDELSRRAPHAGTLVLPTTRDLGAYIAPGEAIATIVAGAPVADLFIDESDAETLALEIGRRASCRPLSDPARGYWATIESIEPAALREGIDPLLTVPGRGAVTIDPATGLASRPLLRVRVRFADDADLAHNAALAVRLEGSPRPLASLAARRVARFLNSIRSEQS